ncbi:hypothetical protein DNK44_21970 [Pseudomonas dryadis]|uniref:Uncharacterized protein n=1 Tax=Phytopseudomonas dryadis TaxID=2487520 RepID=A0A4Q9QV83_9GAMM|nr:hypothetical protein DNK44_21970 [Pseudomonas dryadis]
MTDLNGGALFNAEFGIKHRGSTVPERSGVALSFCRRRFIKCQCYFFASLRSFSITALMSYFFLDGTYLSTTETSANTRVRPCKLPGSIDSSSLNFTRPSVTPSMEPAQPLS